MYISPEIVAEIARSSVPELVNYVSPYLHQSLITGVLLIMSIFSAEVDSLMREYNNHTNFEDPVALEIQKVTSTLGSANLFVMKSLFADSEYSNEDCILVLACEVGVIANQNPVYNFLVSKMFGSKTTCSGSPSQQLFCKYEQIFLQSVIHGKSFCEKQNFKCQIKSFASFVSKLGTKVKLSTPSPVEARSEHVPQFINYLTEVLNAI